jgi:hypothetical protein
MYSNLDSREMALDSGRGIKITWTEVLNVTDSSSFLVEDQLDLLHLILVVLFLEAGSCQQLDQRALHFLHVENAALL